jgi:pimeloyl-ACP methyl ester carboxylesterase
MIDTGEVRLACRISGAPGGPPLVLLHALGEDGSDWDAVAEEFGSRRRVYVPDMRGHGHSERAERYSFELMRDDILGLLDALGLERVSLIGHAMGGVVAYLLAQEYPQRVDKLVLEEAPLPYPHEPPIPEPPIPERPGAERDFDRAAVSALTGQLNSPDAEWDSRLEEVAAPTLLVAGGLTSQVPQGRIAAMAKRLPDSRLVTIPTGHRVHASRPLDFSATIRGFLT